MTKVFMIPGLGADSRLYKNINLPNGFDRIMIEWLQSSQTDSLETYSQAIVKQYDIKKEDILIGVSLGGILSVEIAKQLHICKVVLISSIKTDSEAPLYFRLFRNLPVYKPIPGRLINHLGVLIKPMFGKMLPDDLALFKSMLRNSSPVFMKWAMGAVLNWRNNVIPPNLYHIIGDKDLVFPHKNIVNPTAVIKGGTHIMVFDRADEINTLLADILSR